MTNPARGERAWRCLPCSECHGTYMHDWSCSELPGHVGRRLGVPCGHGNCDVPRSDWLPIPVGFRKEWGRASE